MSDALYIAATGMEAQQRGLENIANNLANVNTALFKKGRAEFTDLILRETARLQSGALDSPADAFASPQMTAAGVAVSGITRMFDAGELKKTDAPLDVAIKGDGFIEVTMPDGSSAFTRGGTLKINKDGMLATASGYPLKPGISIPVNATSIAIGPDGAVQVRVPNQGAAIDVGQIDMVRFSVPGALSVQGANLYRANDASGDAIRAAAGEEGIGELAQGFLEGSNVKMVDEMVNLMLAQRAYEASVKVVQAADEMMGLVNNLRK
jgi:flagellar basal-body rod protein FlgG